MFWIPLITAGISALGTIIGAKKSADAATKAAQTQSTAVDRGIGAITQGYQQGQQALQPYAAGGLEAYNTMRTLSGLGLPTLAQPGGMPASTPPMASASALGVPAQGRSVRPTDPANWYFQGDGLPPLNQFGQEVYKWQELSPQKLADLQVQSAAARQSGYVSMQAPDGSVNEVASWQVPHFLERGARVLPPAQSSWTPDPRNS